MNFAQEVVSRLGTEPKPKPLDLMDVGVVFVVVLAFAAYVALEWLLGQAIRRGLRRTMRRLREEYWKANRK
jgi:ABC-type uncharacterized transport system YnjBCD permease subunit